MIIILILIIIIYHLVDSIKELYLCQCLEKVPFRENLVTALKVTTETETGREGLWVGI